MRKFMQCTETQKIVFLNSESGVCNRTAGSTLRVKDGCMGSRISYGRHRFEGCHAADLCDGKGMSGSHASAWCRVIDYARNHQHSKD